MFREAELFGALEVWAYWTVIGCARVLAAHAVVVTLARLSSIPFGSYRAVAMIQCAVLNNSDSSKPVFANALGAVNTSCSGNATESSIQCSCMHKANSRNIDCHFKTSSGPPTPRAHTAHPGQWSWFTRASGSSCFLSVHFTYLVSLTRCLKSHILFGNKKTWNESILTIWKQH